MLINRKNFLENLRFISSVCERKSTIPILEYFLFQSKDRQINLRGTDLDLTADTSFESETIGGALFCIPTYDTLNALSLMTGDEVELKEEEGRVWLTDDKSKFKLPKLPSEQFPQIDKISEPFEFEIPSHTFKALLRYTGFAATNEASRYALQNIYLTFDNNTLKAWGCNGATLSVFLTKNNLGIADKEIDFPLNAIRPFLLLCEQGERLSVKSAQQYFEISVGNKSVQTRLTTGKSPNIEMIRYVPESKSFVIAQNELRRAVKSVHTVGDLASSITMGAKKSSSSSIKFIKQEGDILAKSDSSDYSSENLLTPEELSDFETFKLDGFYFDKFLSVLSANDKIEAHTSPTKGCLFLFQQNGFTVEFYQQPLTL